MTLDDAWELGFDHVAHRGGRGPPTHHRHEEQPRARHPQGERLPHGAAADRRLQAELAREPAGAACPAVVIGGGLTAIDTATELLAYYLVQVEKIARALETSLEEKRRRGAFARMFDDEEWSQLAGAARSTAASSAPRSEARRSARAATPNVQTLLDEWGGVTLVYRKRAARVARVPPQPRRGHEEPRRGRALRREPRADRGGPRRARPRQGREVRALPATAPRSSSRRGPCASPRARARTSTYEKEYPGTFELDSEEAVLPGPRGRRRRGGQGRPRRRPTNAEGGLLHELRSNPRRQDRLVLRRQPPVLRGQRRQGDGEREGRLPARRRALPRGRRRSTRPTSPRATRSVARSSTSSTTSSSRRSSRSTASRRPSSRSS